MKNTFKTGVKLSGSIIVAALLSFFLCISLNVICTALFTEYTGYDAYGYKNENEEAKLLYTHNYADGDDTKKAEYEEQGYKIIEHKNRSVLSGSEKTAFLVITQVLSFITVLSFASGSVYKQGFKDSNLVRVGHIKKDVLKGLKIGFTANIPFFVLYVITVIMALGTAGGFRTVWYAFLNSHFYSIILWICGGSETVAELGVLKFVLLFAVQLIVPLISATAYVLGFKEINLFEKIIYKKAGK